MIRGTVLRVAGTLVLAALVVLAAATGAQAKSKPKPVKAAKLGIAAPASVTAGEPFDIELTALSKQGRVVRDFTGTLRTTSTSTATTLPASVSFARASKGRVTLRGVELRGAGDIGIAFGGKIRGSARVAVAAGQLAELDVQAPATAVVAEDFRVGVSGADAYGNEADASPATISVAPSGECQAGTCRVSRSGTYTVAADLDGVRAEKTVEVSRAAVASVQISAPASVEAGQTFRPTAAAYDAQGRELEEQSGEIAISLSNGTCGAQGCATTLAGTVRVSAQVDGIGAERAVTVRPGPAKSLALEPQNGLELALPAPSGAHADYSKASARPDRITFSATASDAYGNAVPASSAALSAPGASCSGLTCTGVEAGRPTLTARLGDATATRQLRIATLGETYSMSCRGENYDLNGSLADGCEFAQPDPGHTTGATAIELPRITTCSDSGSKFSFSGIHARDFRNHTGVEGFDDEYRGAPLVWKVQAGSGFCTNDVYLELEGNSADRACLSIKVTGADGRLIDSRILGGNGSVELQTGAGAYRDNEVLTFSVEASCWGSSSTNKTDFTVSGHL